MARFWNALLNRIRRTWDEFFGGGADTCQLVHASW